jgi:hypothetical protein
MNRYYFGLLRKNGLQVLLFIMALSILSIFIPDFEVQAAEIKDISSSSDFAMKSISDLAWKGIIQGDVNGEFHPHDLVSRAEIVKMLVLSLGIKVDTTSATSDFCDVPESHWAFPYIEAAYREGIIKGVADGQFDPDSNCTREQLAQMFINGMKLNDISFDASEDGKSISAKFDDYESISAWARNAVSAAVYGGIIMGTGSRTFSPEMFATKEQMAVVADRFITARQSIQEELDTVANVQITADKIGFHFTFDRPFEKAGIRNIFTQNGSLKSGLLHVYPEIGDVYRFDDEYLTANIIYLPISTINNRDVLVPGETYRVKFLFQMKYGNAKTIECERNVTIQGSAAYVRSAVPVNANQIKIRFSETMEKDSVENPANYSILDDKGRAIPIKNVMSEDGANTVADLNLLNPIRERSKITVRVKPDIRRFHDHGMISPYSTVLISDDHAAPELEQVDSTDDGTHITSISLLFSEPVASGTVMIDNKPAGTAYGKSMVIGGLYLDGAQSHQVSVSLVSDGVNTDKTSVITGIAPIYTPPKTAAVPPKIRNISYTKDSSGRVDTFSLTYDEDLQKSVPTNHIYAFDSNHQPVYTEIPVIDEDGNPILDQNGKPFEPYQLFSCSYDLPENNRKAIFRIVKGVDIYGGRYTLQLPGGLVTDLQYNDSETQTITIEFN